jgi:hypothetical protein
MKVQQKEPKFQPITITIETYEELVELAGFLDDWFCETEGEEQEKPEYQQAVEQIHKTREELNEILDDLNKRN